MNIKRGLRRPTSPGDILLEHYLKPNDISVARFARAVGCSRKHMSNIVHGSARIEPAMAAKIAKSLATATRFWLNLQNAVDAFDAEIATKDWKPDEQLGFAATV